MADQFIRIGRNVTSYMMVNTHPGAIVRYRPDAVNNKAMQKNLQSSEPFEESLGRFIVCSDAHCEGNYFIADAPGEWNAHLRQAHKIRSPFSRMGRLNSELAAKTSELDQAKAAENEACARREELEADVASINAELEPANAPKSLPAKKKAKALK